LRRRNIVENIVLPYVLSRGTVAAEPVTDESCSRSGLCGRVGFFFEGQRHLSGPPLSRSGRQSLDVTVKPFGIYAFVQPDSTAVSDVPLRVHFGDTDQQTGRDQTVQHGPPRSRFHVVRQFEQSVSVIRPSAIKAKHRRQKGVLHRGTFRVGRLAKFASDHRLPSWSED
jgi:hypothetical protein